MHKSSMRDPQELVIDLTEDDDTPIVFNTSGATNRHRSVPLPSNLGGAGNGAAPSSNRQSGAKGKSASSQAHHTSTSSNSRILAPGRDVSSHSASNSHSLSDSDDCYIVEDSPAKPPPRTMLSSAQSNLADRPKAHEHNGVIISSLNNVGASRASPPASRAHVPLRNASPIIVPAARQTKEDSSVSNHSPSSPRTPSPPAHQRPANRDQHDELQRREDDDLQDAIRRSNENEFENNLKRAIELSLKIGSSSPSPPSEMASREAGRHSGSPPSTYASIAASLPVKRQSGDSEEEVDDELKHAIEMSLKLGSSSRSPSSDAASTKPYLSSALPLSFSSVIASAPKKRKKSENPASSSKARLKQEGNVGEAEDGMPMHGRLDFQGCETLGRNRPCSAPEWPSKICWLVKELTQDTTRNDGSRQDWHSPTMVFASILREEKLKHRLPPWKLLRFLIDALLDVSTIKGKTMMQGEAAINKVYEVLRSLIPRPRDPIREVYETMQRVDKGQEDSVYYEAASLLDIQPVELVARLKDELVKMLKEGNQKNEGAKKAGSAQGDETRKFTSDSSYDAKKASADEAKKVALEANKAVLAALKQKQRILFFRFLEQLAITERSCIQHNTEIVLHKESHFLAAGLTDKPASTADEASLKDVVHSLHALYEKSTDLFEEAVLQDLLREIVLAQPSRGNLKDTFFDILRNGCAKDVTLTPNRGLRLLVEAAGSCPKFGLIIMWRGLHCPTPYTTGGSPVEVICTQPPTWSKVLSACQNIKVQDSYEQEDSDQDDDSASQVLAVERLHLLKMSLIRTKLDADDEVASENSSGHIAAGTHSSSSSSSARSSSAAASSSKAPMIQSPSHNNGVSSTTTSTSSSSNSRASSSLFSNGFASSHASSGSGGGGLMSPGETGAVKRVQAWLQKLDVGSGRLEALRCMILQRMIV